ncbi:OmpA family protein [Fuscibacter oryzae]|uniref:OmpA family protein n=1 Tax=Fuscibacter oryzae TaxID=2803939 RepID=A0A8J7MTF6_9RHOB|nr:OmpA family protein [Fuscibacter oryzae]MBL4927064.1 OmpA family protein [Fuscibacter oryzae]
MQPLCTAALAVLAACPAIAVEAPLTFPATAEITASHSQPMTSYSLAIGPFRDGALQVRPIEGAVDQTAWRFGADGVGTLEILAPLRQQLRDQGFTSLYECQSEGCGGYDFRYASDVLAEPDMHVDLGDFRYFAAERAGAAGPVYVALLISRSAHDGFVQMTRIGPELAAPDALTTSTKSPQQLAPATPLDAVAPVAAAPVTAPPDMAGKLASGQPAVLDGLVFPSGSANLAAGEYPELVALGDWLRADPARKALLVGHTDASGTQAANLRLSKARAESVRRWLIDTLSVDAAQVSADGAGFLAPRASNATDEGRRQNRRVEVIATSTLSVSP